MEDVLKVLRAQETFHGRCFKGTASTGDLSWKMFQRYCEHRRPFMEDVLKVLRAQETFHGRCFKGTASTGDLSWKMF